VEKEGPNGEVVKKYVRKFGTLPSMVSAKLKRIDRRVIDENKKVNELNPEDERRLQ
jgi:hypothetical protein